MTAPRKQHGLTHAELLVAMALGLMVALMAGALLVSANGAYQSQVDAAGVDDGGRYALEIIARAARQTAFVNWDRDEVGVGIDPTAPANIAGLDDHALDKVSDGIDDPLPGAVNGSDVLALRFVGSGPAPDGDGSVISCAGFSVGALEQGWSIFYVARSAAGDAELRCKYRGKTSWGADAIVGGVDSFQVLYGLDTDVPPDGVANQYVSASTLDHLDQSLLLTGADPAARARELRRRTHWKRIASIKVALVLHGAGHAASGREPAVFDLFGPAYGDAFGAIDPGTRLREVQMTDDLRRRERKLFAVTTLLRNPSGEAR
ncbi:MAG TPA: PilW family protein [Telluria sp.]|nr:PilW family protein [Telluria sp.]